MSKKKDRKGLGRGLSALMADIDRDTKITSNTVSNTSSNMLPIEKVIANPNQPRQDFNKEDLEDLTQSIASRGIIQPIIVRVSKENNDLYQIVAGERRWRAAQKAQLHEVPVVVRDFTDEELLEVAIIENVQRSNLNPVEEALAYK
ncbi:ParB/RepB/Spo0J family partition protein, partial [Amylibacter sp.]|nr:ParB/RepB/Spo0J family partition protein [Amylibacter sp.]